MHMYVYVYVYVYVCAHECMCVHVCTHICTFVCVHESRIRAGTFLFSDARLTFQVVSWMPRGRYCKVIRCL